MQQHCKLRGRGSEVSVSWNTGWNINNDKHLQLLWVMFLAALLPKIANEQLQEWNLKLDTELGPLEGTSPVHERVHHKFNGQPFSSTLQNCGWI